MRTYMHTVLFLARMELTFTRSWEGTQPGHLTQKSQMRYLVT